METTIMSKGIYRGFIGIMEKKMETTIMGNPRNPSRFGSPKPNRGTK